MKSKQKLIHVIQLCGRKKGMLYITVAKIRGGGVKNRAPVTIKLSSINTLPHES